MFKTKRLYCQSPLALQGCEPMISAKLNEIENQLEYFSEMRAAYTSMIKDADKIRYDLPNCGMVNCRECPLSIRVSVLIRVGSNEHTQIVAECAIVKIYDLAESRVVG